MSQTTTFAPGTVIEARKRLWRVDDQRGNELLVTNIEGTETEQYRLYIPFEDIRPGRLEPPDATRVGNPAANKLLIQAYRLSMLHGTAPLLSLQRSRVVPTNYQLIPVVMSLDMPRVRMLLADDVGLGKTIEAGLILTELLARQRASRLLVICPANLQEQWREQLDYFFHIDAKIMSTRYRRELERPLPAGANPWEFYRCLITSVDYAKTPVVKNQILEQDWDAVVIDEAHTVAKPHQASPDQSIKMERWQLAEAVAKKAKHLIMLTATPHNGYTDSFASILRMLDIGAVAGPVHNPAVNRKIARKYVCQRRRRDVEDWFEAEGKKSPFPKRDQDELVIPLNDSERKVVDAVEELAGLILESAQGEAKSYMFAKWTVMHLHKRALSSPEALRRSLSNRKKVLKQRLEGLIGDTDETTGLPIQTAQANVFDEDTGERHDEEEAGLRMERSVWGSKEAVRKELKAVELIAELASKITPSKDSKLRYLLDNLLRERISRKHKVIIFTRYLDTLQYLEQQVEKAKKDSLAYRDIKVITVYGGLNEVQRRERFKEFEKSGKAVMIATDAISEGINLQHAASQVIHYELPWNPNRLEQRNGRIDRYGQDDPEVFIRTLVMQDTLDVTILKVLMEKALRIRNEYGFAPPYFGDDANIIDLIKREGVHIRMPKNIDQMELFAGEGGQIWGETEAESIFSDEAIERVAEESYYGQTDIALPDIQRRMDETARTVGSPERVEQFVLSGLKRFGCSVKKTEGNEYRIAVTAPNLQTTLTGPVIERATFDAEAALDDPDLTLLDTGHPLVRRLIDTVKHAAFYDEENYGRTSAMETKDVAETTAVFHLLVRYVVETEPLSIIEELLPVGIPVYNARALPREVSLELIESSPEPTSRIKDEIVETLRDALAREDLEGLLDKAVLDRMKELVHERQELKQRLLSEKSEELTRWLEGIDRISVGSKDLLAINIYYPA